MPSATPSRPRGKGLPLVRRMRRSVSRSHTWFNAAAPPATSAVPMSVCAASASATPFGDAEVKTGERRDQDEQIESRLGEREEVQRAVRSGSAASAIGSRHRRAVDDVRAHLHACPRADRWIGGSDRTRSYVPSVTRRPGPVPWTRRVASKVCRGGCEASARATSQAPTHRSRRAGS